VKSPEDQAAEWNQKHAVGTPVTYHRLIHPLRDPVETRTRSEAWVIGGHTAVVMVEGVSGAVALVGVKVRHERRTTAMVTADQLPADFTRLKALSIRQPWAWLIAQGVKRFENRDWDVRNPGRKFRGRFLIHASQGMTKDEYAMAHTVAEEHGQPLPEFRALERGGIVAVGEIVKWHDTKPDMPFAFGSGLELANVKPLPFIPCRGALGFFKPVIVWPLEGAMI
jgi:hypothetical protein